MGRGEHPTMDEICDALDRLADRIARNRHLHLDPYFIVSIRRVTEELRRYIPGFDVPPDVSAARDLARAAYDAMREDDALMALTHTLHGLSRSPHHLGLWYGLALIFRRLHHDDGAVYALRYALHVHPGHGAARRELEVMSTEAARRWTRPGAISADQRRDDDVIWDEDDEYFAPD